MRLRLPFVVGMIHSAVPTILLLCVVAVTGNSYGEDSSTTAAKTPRPVASTVDSLASRCEPPKIVKLEPATWKAIFPNNYDWKEQDRVVSQVRWILDHPTPGMWAALVAHAKDDRYCMTFNDQEASADHFSVNWTVGRLCKKIALSQMYSPLRKAEESLPAAENGSRIFLPITEMEGIPWGKPISNDFFVAFQLRLCRQALADLDKIVLPPDVAPEDRVRRLQQCRESLKASIRFIEKNKTGEFGPFSFPGERFDFSNSQKADQVRLEYEEAKRLGTVKGETP